MLSLLKDGKYMYKQQLEGVSQTKHTVFNCPCFTIE